MDAFAGASQSSAMGAAGAGGPGLYKNTESEIEQVNREIIEISKCHYMDPAERARRMQHLMTRRWELSQPQFALPAYAGDVSSLDTSLSYHDAERGILGCQHYQRKAKLRAACCGKLFPCRFCHDEVSDHAMDRYATKEMMCYACKLVQPIQKTCRNESCGVTMARYYCDSCKFFDDHPSKDIYHCKDCNLCRIGKGIGIDYFHCHTCNACMSLNHQNHKCIERLLESDCPICNQYMFTSTMPVMFVACGHAMHVMCFEQYSKTNYICPICKKALWDVSEYFQSLDAKLAQEQMPDEYRDSRQEIQCRDCQQKSVTAYHNVYHKCGPCGSYNTDVLHTFKVTDAHGGATATAPSGQQLSTLGGPAGPSQQ
eukprot:GFYU01001354.1.p1 GENE.GFYU01001354.1~~GFYU01001354.1.p1  ORF type:complete len:370 (+),score=28.88 GFYU01001354.1:300-1409(+)